MSTAPTMSSNSNVSLVKSLECVYIHTHYKMGIGRMKQIDVKVMSEMKESEARTQKRLIDSPELDEIRSQDGFMQRHIDALTAYADAGTRFLPTTQAEGLYRVMEAYRTIHRPLLVEKFMVKYRELEVMDFAPLRETLKDQFRREDYLRAEDVKNGFAFTFNLTPVGEITKENMKGLPDFIIALEIEKEHEARRAAIAEWQTAMRATFCGLVEKLFDAIKPQSDGKKRTFKDASFINLVEFLKSAPMRDLADDAQAQAEMDNVRTILSSVTPEKLRESSNLKKFVADSLEKIKPALGALVQESGRKFR